MERRLLHIDQSEIDERAGEGEPYSLDLIRRSEVAPRIYA